MEALHCLVRPPALHVTRAVEQTSLVVKPVRDLVTDYHADSSEVETPRKVAVIEWRLEDSSRKHCNKKDNTEKKNTQSRT